MHKSKQYDAEKHKADEARDSLEECEADVVEHEAKLQNARHELSSAENDVRITQTDLEQARNRIKDLTAWGRWTRKISNAQSDVAMAQKDLMHAAQERQRAADVVTDRETVVERKTRERDEAHECLRRCVGQTLERAVAARDLAHAHRAKSDEMHERISASAT